MYSFVIPAKDRQEHLDSCLRSVLWQDYEDYEVVVANYDERPFLTVPEGVRILRERGREWNQSVALNMGIAHARGERIVILGCDGIMAPDLLTVVDGMWADEQQLYWRRFDLTEQSLKHVRGLNGWCLEEDVSGEWHGTCAYGDFLAVDREILVELGGFDEEMSGWGYFDRDMQQRLESRGYETVWGLDFKLLHQYHEPIFLHGKEQEQTHKRNEEIAKRKGHSVVRNEGPQTFQKYLRRQW